MWLIPSRERPHKVKRFIRAYHAVHSTTPFLVIVDETDPSIIEYRSLCCPLMIVPGETVGLAGKVRAAYKRHPERQWYGMLPDDCEPMTKGWDKAMVEAACPDRVAYCSHGVKGLKIRALPCIGAELIKAVGYILPDFLEHYATDAFWWRLAEQTGRLKWLPDHTVRLTDRVNGEPESAWDAPKRRQKARQSEDDQAWQAFRKSDEWRDLVTRLRV